MPKVNKTRVHSKARIDVKQKIDLNQEMIPSYFKPVDHSKAQHDSGQKVREECFPPKHLSYNFDPIAHRIKLKQVFLIQGDYDKKAFLQRKNEYKKQLKKKDRLPENYKCWNGYMLSATDDFTKFDVHTMVARTDKTKIYKAGKRVATASIDNDSALTEIDVEAPFRGNKIGSELIRFICERDENFMVFSGTANNSRYRLTHEGAGLIKYCEEVGILDSSQVIMESPYSPSWSQ